jgi:hypothetical protein
MIPLLPGVGILDLPFVVCYLELEFIMVESGIGICSLLPGFGILDLPFVVCYLEFGIYNKVWSIQNYRSPVISVFYVAPAIRKN